MVYRNLASKIGFMTPAGAFCNVGVHGEIATHTAASQPRGITVGSGRQPVVRRILAKQIGCITTP